MKRSVKLTAACLLGAALCACSASGEKNVTVTQAETSLTETDDGASAGRAALFYSADGETAYTPEPFSSYSFDYSDGENKYMITVAVNSTSDAFELTLEDSQFGFSTFEITAPRDYALNIPFSQEQGSSVCRVLKNSYKEKVLPDILEFTFYLNNFDNEDNPYSVKKFYAVNNGQLSEITLIDSGADRPDNALHDMLMTWNGNVMEYCTDFSLRNTEAGIFMPPPEVEFAEDGSARVTIYSYSFDPDNMTMIKYRQPISFDSDPLYFGYAAEAVADDIAKYFTTTSLNVEDYENYIELPSVSNPDVNDYFFKVADERFPTLDRLKEFTRRYFSEKLVNEMFLNAPQKYRDIDGALYTIVGDGGMDFTLGDRLITGWDISGNEITYHTKQEKFTEEGEFKEYIDSGDFVINLNADGTFLIIKYNLKY